MGMYLELSSEKCLKGMGMDYVWVFNRNKYGTSDDYVALRSRLGYVLAGVGNKCLVKCELADYQACGL